MTKMFGWGSRYHRDRISIRLGYRLPWHRRLLNLLRRSK